MSDEKIKAIMYVTVGAIAAIVSFVYWLIDRKRRAAQQPGVIRRNQKPTRAGNGASVRFKVGVAYWCHDKGWGDSAHLIIRRGEKKALISCDIIQKRSDVEVWRYIHVDNGVETMERGNIRADDEYTGKRGFAPIYAAAKKGTSL